MPKIYNVVTSRPPCGWPVADLHEAALHVTSRIEPTVGWIGSVAVAEIRAPDPIGSLLLVHHKPSWQWGFERERGRQIDHILVRCGDHGPPLDVVGCTLAFSEPVDGVWASDHFGLVADLALPQHSVSLP